MQKDRTNRFNLSNPGQKLFLSFAGLIIWLAVFNDTKALAARMLTSGFELDDTVGAVEESGLTGSPSIQTTVKRTGTYALNITGLSSGSPMKVGYRFSGSNLSGPYYARAYLRVDTLPTGDNLIMTLSASGIPEGNIALTSAGNLALYNATNLIGTSSSSLSTGTWYRIELEFDDTAGGSSGIIRGYLDGTEFAGSSSLTIGNGVQYLYVGGNMSTESQTQGIGILMILR